MGILLLYIFVFCNIDDPPSTFIVLINCAECLCNSVCGMRSVVNIFQVVAYAFNY